jgi:hypothetical protein
VGAAEALGGLRKDCIDDTIEIIDDLAVPETDDGPSLSGEKARPTLIIILSFQMLRAVKFHSQLR